MSSKMISLQKKSLFFRFLQRMDVEVLNRFLALLDKNDGRDKVCKIVQYTLKLVLVWQENYYKPRVGKLAKQLSETRRILRISRFLKCKDSLKEAFMEQKALVSYVSLCSAGVGTLSNIADDVCWASDIGILPQWISEYEIWGSYCWWTEMCLELPMTTYDLFQIHRVYQAVDVRDKKALHNAKVDLISAWMTQIKRMVDFLHASRLAHNWPSGNKGQDAICGLISASISFLKLWKLNALQKV